MKKILIVEVPEDIPIKHIKVKTDVSGLTFNKLPFTVITPPTREEIARIIEQLDPDSRDGKLLIEFLNKFKEDKG